MSRRCLMSTWRMGRNQGCQSNICQPNETLKFWTWKLNEEMCRRDNLKVLNQQVIQTLLSRSPRSMKTMKDKKFESSKHLKELTARWESSHNTLNKRCSMHSIQNQVRSLEWIKPISENTVLTQHYEQTIMKRCKKKHLNIYLVVIISFKHKQVIDS